MKKSFGLMISLVMTLSLLLASVGVIYALPMPTTTTTTLPDPQLTVASGAPKFTSDLLAIENLPGTSTLSDGMLVPAGFTAGSKQFEGEGVQVNGLLNGTIKACFPITGISSGWSGQIGLWTGSKWNLLATKITAADEAPYSWACTNISMDGTYALIKWVADPSKLPTTGVCSFGIDYIISTNYGIWGPLSTPTNWAIGFYVPASIPTGTPVTFSISNVDPTWPGTIISGFSGTTTVGLVAPNTIVFSSNPVILSQAPGPSFTAHFVFPTLNCYLDLPYYAYLYGD